MAARRISGGADIDLILEFSPTEKWAIAIKRSSSPSLSKGFHIACEDVEPQRRYVVYSGKDRFKISPNITAISLSDLMQEILNLAQSLHTGKIIPMVCPTDPNSS